MSFAADTRCPCKVRPAVNFGDRAAHLPLDILLLHYTGMDSAEAAIDWLCNEESGVSCHYFVYENGDIVQLVQEEKRAWHAGKSIWQGESDTNSRSIGVEIVNPGHNLGYPDFPEVQIASVIELCRDILSRHAIPSRNVLAHSDVAPGRKPDPGEKFPWDVLYHAGIGHWVAEAVAEGVAFSPGENSEEIASFQALLSAYGYGLEITGNYDKHTRDCVVAFQRHFRRSKVDGLADGSTRQTLEKLLRNVNYS